MDMTSLNPLNPEITCQTLEETLEKIEATPSLLERGLVYEVCLRVFEQIKANTQVQEKLPPITAKIEALPQKFWFSYGIYTIYRTVANFFSRLLPSIFHHLEEENKAYSKLIQEIETKTAIACGEEILSKKAEQEASFLAERFAVEFEAALADFDLNAEEKRLYDSLLETSLQEKAALTSKLLAEIEEQAEKGLQATMKEESEAFEDLLTHFHGLRIGLEEEETRLRLVEEEVGEITTLLQTQTEELLLLDFSEKARAADEAKDYVTAFSFWQEVLSRQKADPTEQSYKEVLLHWVQAHVLSEQTDPSLTRDHLTYLLALGKCHLEQKALDNAAKFFAKVLEIVPDHPKALRLAAEIRAESLALASNFQEAYPLFLELGQKERALSVLEAWKDSYRPHPLPLEATLAIAEAYLKLDSASKADFILGKELKGKAGISEAQREPLLSLYKGRLETLQARTGREKMEKHRLLEIIYRLEGGAENCNRLFQSCLDEAREVLRLEETPIILRDIFTDAAKLALTLKARPEQARDLGLLCIRGGLPEKAIEALSIKRQTDRGPRYLYEEELKEALDAALRKIGYPLSGETESMQAVSSPANLNGEGYLRFDEISNAEVYRDALFEYAFLYSELHEPEETWAYLKEMERQGLNMGDAAHHSLFMSCLEKALEQCSCTRKIELLSKFNVEWPLEEIHNLIIANYDSLIKGYDKRIAEGASLPTSEKLQLQETRFRYFLQRDQVSSSDLTKQKLSNAHEALVLSYRLAAEQETNLDQKIRYLSRVLELKPEDINSKQAIVYAPLEAANAAERAQKWKEAVQHILHALELNKHLNAVDPLPFCKRLGVCYYHLNEYDQAFTFFSKTTVNGDRPDESRIRHILEGDRAYQKALADFTPRLKQQIYQFVQDMQSEPFWPEIERTLGYRLGSWSSENREFASLGYYNKNYEEIKKEAVRAVELMATAYDSRHLNESIPNTVVHRINLLQSYLNALGSSNADLNQALQEYRQAHQSNPHLYEPYLHSLFEIYSILGDTTAMNVLRQRFPDKF